MFIQLTSELGYKVLVNTRHIVTVAEIEGSGCALGLTGAPCNLLHVRESYRSIVDLVKPEEPEND